MIATVPYPIEALFDLARSAGIAVGWYPDGMSPRAKYLAARGVRAILLSPSLQESPMRLRCALAHELGHHFAGFSGTSLSLLRDEASATRWAQDLLLPEDWLLSHLELAPGEMAEEAGVYELWVRARIARLKLSWSVACVS